MVVQRSASVRFINRDGRINLTYSGEFDLKNMMCRLLSLQSRCNIGVRHFSGSSYSLDLTKVVTRMSTLSNAKHLDDFAKHKSSKALDWLNCFIDYDHSIDSMVCQIALAD